MRTQLVVLGWESTRLGKILPASTSFSDPTVPNMARRTRAPRPCVMFEFLSHTSTTSHNTSKGFNNNPKMNVEQYQWHTETVCWMLNVECWMLNVECWMLNVVCCMFYVLCFMFYVLCFMFYVLCFMLLSNCICPLSYLLYTHNFHIITQPAQCILQGTSQDPLQFWLTHQPSPIIILCRCTQYTFTTSHYNLCTAQHTQTLQSRHLNNQCLSIPRSPSSPLLLSNSNTTIITITQTGVVSMVYTQSQINAGGARSLWATSRASASLDPRRRVSVLHFTRLVSLELSLEVLSFSSSFSPRFRSLELLTKKDIGLLNDELSSPKYGEYHICIYSFSLLFINSLPESSIHSHSPSALPFCLIIINSFFQHSQERFVGGICPSIRARSSKGNSGIASPLFPCYSSLSLLLHSFPLFFPRLSSLSFIHICKLTNQWTYRGEWITRRSCLSSAGLMCRHRSLFTTTPVTPLLMQWNYQAIIHEVLTLTNNLSTSATILGVCDDLKVSKRARE